MYFTTALGELKSYLRAPTNVSMLALQKHADVIVISIGSWEEGKKDICARYSKEEKNYTEAMLQIRRRTFGILNEYQKLSNKTIVWRTNGFFDIGPRADTQLTKTLNKDLMDSLDFYQNPGVTYVNYGEAIEPRSFGPRQIKGDHVAHYGFQARIVLIEMLVNHLLDLGVLSREI